MILLTGPAGSGKTARVLREFQETLGLRRAAPRLLVPTATLSEHLRNELARDGVVLRSRSVSTLAQFAQELAPQVSVVASGHFQLMVEAAVLRLHRQELAKVQDLAGVHARLASTISDLDAAGCTPRDLVRVRRELAPFRDAIVAVWEDVERLMRERDQVTRGAQLRGLTRAVASAVLPERIWVDGFAQLSAPEIDLLCALGARTPLTLTLPDEGVRPELKAALVARGFEEQRMAGTRDPEEMFVMPETAERECEEICRRALDTMRAGTPFREIGVIVRQPARYEPLLRAALERFGVPAHFYFGQPLARHAAARLLAGVVDALLGGWDHAQVIGLFRLIPAVGTSNALDILEIKVKETMPGQSLDPLAERTGDRGLRRVVSQLQGLEPWLAARWTPEQWAERFEALPALFWPGYLGDGLTGAEIEQLRDQAAGLRAFQDAIGLAAAWFAPNSAPIRLNEFWRVAKSLIAAGTVTARNRSRDVVHVISAYEARQWDFSTALVCGLVEKEFPAQNSRDPFLSDAALHDLRRMGVHARTSADKDAEEFGLFDAVRRRARDRLILLHPRLDARGQRALPSIFLKGRVADQTAPPVRPALPPHIAQWRQPVTIQDPGLLQVLREQQKLSVTNLESLLQCPFQFFARRALRVYEMPLLPEDRLSFLLQGNIAHEVLREWFQVRQDNGSADMAAIFARVFQRICNEKHVLPGFRTERLRRAMLLSLQCFAADRQYPKPLSSETEQAFDVPIDDTLRVTGKLDRIDQLADGRWAVVDYKFSTAANTKERVDDESKLQGPLYAMASSRALGKSPSAMVYASLRDKVRYYGWGVIEGLILEPMTVAWAESAMDRVRHAVAEFREGTVHPRPLHTGPCRYCDYRDACRVEQLATVTAAGV